MTNTIEVESMDEAFKDPAPSISLPESVIIELQRGLINPTTGQWQTTAEVRELNGKDEEFLSSLENNKKITYAMYVNTLVSRATVRIGDTNVRNTKSIIEELITGDRDILLLAILKATYGAERTFKYPCSSCNTLNDVTINPFLITLKNGSKLKFRYPVGSDNVAMAKGETTAQQSTLLISRCVIWDQHKDSLYSEEWAKDLGLKDRNTILGEILGPKVGPKLGEVKTQCATCDADIIMNVDWVSLLLA